MFPAPTTIATLTPRSWASFTWRAIPAMRAGSMP